MSEIETLGKLNVELHLNEYGFGQVLVNGVDWSKRVQEIHLKSVAGGMALLHLVVWPTDVKLVSSAEVVILPEQRNVEGDVVLLQRQKVKEINLSEPGS